MLENIIKSRRSISQFKNKKVSRKVIDELIEIASYAPSSCNTQPWFFLVFDDQKSKQQLNNFISKGYDLTKKDIMSKYKILGKIYIRILTFFENYGTFDEAPVYILLFAREYDTPLFSQALKVSKYTPIQKVADNSVITSTAMAMQNFTLIAHKRGLGTRVKDGIKFLQNFKKLEQGLYKEFKIPKKYTLISGIQLGYPTSKALERKVPKKLPLNKIRRYMK